MFDQKQAETNKRIGASFLSLPEEAAWGWGIALDKVIIQRTAEGWLCIVKGKKRRRPVAVYIHSRTYAEALEDAGFLLECRGVTWKEDKYPHTPK